MTVVSYNDVTDHTTSPSTENRSTGLVHTAWAGWYYEGAAAEAAESGAVPSRNELPESDVKILREQFAA